MSANLDKLTEYINFQLRQCGGTDTFSIGRKDCLREIKAVVQVLKSKKKKEIANLITPYEYL
jgi:hypothetical protein